MKNTAGRKGQTKQTEEDEKMLFVECKKCRCEMLLDFILNDKQ